MIVLDEMDSKAWAGVEVDDTPEPLRDPVTMGYGAAGPAVKARKLFQWPQETVERFGRLLLASVRP